MEITLNDKPTQLPNKAPTTLMDLVKLKFPDSQLGIAVAIKKEVLPKEDWAKHVISENEEIHIFRAFQGG